jgi:hypothetical protein
VDFDKPDKILEKSPFSTSRQTSMQIDTQSDADKAKFSTFLASRFKATRRSQIEQTWAHYLREDGFCTHGGIRQTILNTHRNVVWGVLLKELGERIRQNQASCDKV